jgi:hypothetical protein
MKRKLLWPLAAVAVLLFLWTARENFEDTATVQGPPYGNTAESAQKIINMMPPDMLRSISRAMGVSSDPLTDKDKVKIVYGDGTNNSPIAQVMSNFYWQVYKPATSTISIAQVNKFLSNQTDDWVGANQSNTRQFLIRYFVQGSNGAAQSGYGDILNSVFGGGVKAQAKEEKKIEEPTEKKTTDSTSTIVMISLGIAGVSVIAVILTLLLPARV